MPISFIKAYGNGGKHNMYALLFFLIARIYNSYNVSFTNIQLKSKIAILPTFLAYVWSSN